MQVHVLKLLIALGESTRGILRALIKSPTGAHFSTSFQLDFNSHNYRFLRMLTNCMFIVASHNLEQTHVEMVSK